MDGLYIGKVEKPVETTIQDSAELSLLADGSGPEVMIYKILAHKLFYVYPSEIPEAMEFFYVLEGQVEYSKGDTKIQINSGEYFYTRNLSNPVFFTALVDVKILYISTQPVFSNLSSSIKSLTDTIRQVEQKDQYTFKHSQNVQYYSMKMAQRMHLSMESVESLNFASLFHDIGKIFIEDMILNKTGKLCEEEMERIKEHPFLGSNLASASFCKKISDIIAMHHERMDGSGYPKGLRGEEILLEAKIVAVADTYDAMTTDRPYRGAIAPKQAIEEIKGLAGRHYDEAIVEVFEQILKDEGKI